LAEEDEFISKAAWAAIKAALASKKNTTVFSYPGQHHAFARHNGAHYNAKAATLANGRTRSFLSKHLRWSDPQRRRSRFTDERNHR
jgi:carboxymethylenebutenolidase